MSAGLSAAASIAAGDGARAWGTAAIDLAVIRRGLRDAWRGASAEATLSASGAIAERMGSVIAELDYLADVLLIEGGELESAIEAAVEAAEAGGVAAPGTSAEPRDSVDGGDVEGAADVAAEARRRVAAADEALVARLSSSAALDAVRALEQGPAARPSGAGLVDASTVAASASVGPLGAIPSALPEDPRALAAQWHSLGPTERAAWAARHPELSDAAGLPAGSRDALNRAEIAAALGAGARRGAGAAEAGSSSRRLTSLAAHLRDHPEARVLTLRGDGRGAVAEGDPGRAGRVVTLVPGTGSSLESVGISTDRAVAACSAAETVAGTVDPPCVPVVWQDYEAPQDLVSAALDENPARAGAPALRDFQAGLRALGDGELDVLGYSYGGIVAGEAAAGGAGLPADGLLFVASPGTDADTDARGDAGADGERLSLVDAEGRARPGDADSVGSVVQRWDPVPWWALTRTYGPAPGSTDVGAAATSVGGVPDHGGYFDEGAPSLEEIGRALVGFGR